MTAVQRRARNADEVPLTLDQPVTRSLRLIDQLGLWSNLGISLLGFTGAIFVLAPVVGAPALSLGAALTALVVGTLLGTAAVSIAAIPGTETGSPAMVLLRGVFGARLSWLPTTLNIVQLIGWTTFEIVIISEAMHQVTDGVPKWAYVLGAGFITTGLALYPLGWIRTLRKYVTVLVVIAFGYLAIQMLRNPLPALSDGTWDNFWLAVDTVIGVAVSWVPVASDYSRHSKSVKDTVIGSFVGYSITQIACYAVGLVVLVTVAQGDSEKIFGEFIAVPLGALAFTVLAVREVDQSFVDTYSTTVSVQNLRPRWDRRVIALVIGTLATVLALSLDIEAYENFLLLIGGVFVPLLGVLAVDYFVISRRQWDLSESAPTRWVMLVPWVLGFLTYQLVNPGYVQWWAEAWTHIRGWLHFTPQSWMSASIISFVVAAAVTLALLPIARRKT